LKGASWEYSSAWRTYEWNPIHDPLRPSDGELKSVRDMEGRYLAYLQYEPVEGEGNEYSKGG